LGPFLKSCLQGRADMKESSKTVRWPIVKDLTKFFGESRVVRTITIGA